MLLFLRRLFPIAESIWAGEGVLGPTAALKEAAGRWGASKV